LICPAAALGARHHRAAAVKTATDARERGMTPPRELVTGGWPCCYRAEARGGQDLVENDGARELPRAPLLEPIEPP